jgi:hypothetical protein
VGRSECTAPAAASRNAGVIDGRTRDAWVAADELHSVPSAEGSRALLREPCKWTKRVALHVIEVAFQHPVRHPTRVPRRQRIPSTGWASEFAALQVRARAGRHPQASR